MPPNPAPPGPIRSFVAWIGSGVIYALIRVFGRVVRDADVPWLTGPVGGDYIGDTPYEELARREGLTLERDAEAGGLFEDFGALRGDHCDPDRVDPRIRHFYEHTTAYRMDLWARTWFPANVALWLLVATISRKVNQLNFPLDVLETAKGLDSEIALLREPSGRVRYAGWYRRLASTGRSVYTGFYMVQVTPHTGQPCVKVVFPMPNGNATVILRPEVGASGDLILTSSGAKFGDVGFYRLQRIDGERLRAWRIHTLRERFRVYVDGDGTVRCDHTVRFLGLPVLQLHYRMDLRPTNPDTVRR